MEQPETLESALAKVRRLNGSNLSHQSKPAQLLIAVESSLQSTLPSTSSSTSPSILTPTAYFSALFQCLEKAVNDDVGEDEDLAETENMGQGALIPATIYLLAIIIPETPNTVVLSKLSPLLECLLPLFDTALEHPPALRSLLQITTTLLLFANTQVLNSSPLLKKAWNYLLELNLDPRPKVRHLAQEGVRKVLCTPVPPKVTPGSHPYLVRAREWVTSHLEEEVKTGGSSSKGKKARFGEADDGEGKKVIWIVQGLRGWVAVWGDEVSYPGHIQQWSSLMKTAPVRVVLPSLIPSTSTTLDAPNIFSARTSPLSPSYRHRRKAISSQQPPNDYRIALDFPTRSEVHFDRSSDLPLGSFIRLDQNVCPGPTVPSGFLAQSVQPHLQQYPSLFRCPSCRFTRSSRRNRCARYRQVLSDG